MRRMTKTKQQDMLIESAFGKHFNRVQIPLMDIPKIYREARIALEHGMSLDNAMEVLAMTYKQANAEAGQ
jgi:hypothetical protein